MGGKTCCLLLCSKGNENLPKIKNKDRFCLDGMADQARPEPQARHMAADQSRKVIRRVLCLILQQNTQKNVFFVT